MFRCIRKTSSRISGRHHYFTQPIIAIPEEKYKKEIEMIPLQSDQVFEPRSEHKEPETIEHFLHSDPTPTPEPEHIESDPTPTPEPEHIEQSDPTPTPEPEYIEQSDPTPTPEPEYIQEPPITITHIPCSHIPRFNSMTIVNSKIEVLSIPVTNIKAKKKRNKHK
jgi:hypothetical protein